MVFSGYIICTLCNYSILVFQYLDGLYIYYVTGLYSIRLYKFSDTMIFIIIVAVLELQSLIVTGSAETIEILIIKKTP